jgi:transcriptional regulator with XRE-family HTH domain
MRPIKSRKPITRLIVARYGTVTRFAHELGVPRVTLANYLRGHRAPDPGTLARIRALLGDFPVSRTKKNRSGFAYL